MLPSARAFGMAVAGGSLPGRVLDGNPRGRTDRGWSGCRQERMRVNFFSKGHRIVWRLAGAFGILAVLTLGGCSSVDAKRAAPRPAWLVVRSTAYTHSEPGGGRNAVGTRLRFGGEVSSAAADWSWLPLGTRFRVQETGRSYVVEDYGSGLVGKKTVDLYVPSEAMMRGWGVRWVTVEILEWGSPAMSRMLLERRRDARPARQMLAVMDQQSD